MCLEALKEVNSAATALSGEVADVLEAVLAVKAALGVLDAVSDGLGAAAAGVEDLAAAELARQRVVSARDGAVVALGLVSEGGGGGDGSEGGDKGELHC